MRKACRNNAIGCIRIAMWASGHLQLAKLEVWQPYYECGHSHTIKPSLHVSTSIHIWLKSSSPHCMGILYGWAFNPLHTQQKTTITTVPKEVTYPPIHPLVVSKSNQTQIYIAPYIASESEALYGLQHCNASQFMCWFWHYTNFCILTSLWMHVWFCCVSFSVLSQETGWELHPRNDLSCAECLNVQNNYV